MFAMMLDHPEFDPKMFETLELITYGAAPRKGAMLDDGQRRRPDVRMKSRD